MSLKELRKGGLTVNKKSIVFLLFLLFVLPLSAAPISFYGGKTSVSLEDGNRTVTLTGGAGVSSESIKLSSDKIFIYGEDYRYVRCTGNVSVTDNEREISLVGSNVFYDRLEKLLLSDGWVEMEDKKNQAKISGARIEYNEGTSEIIIQMRASISKETEKGLLKCSADIITYNADNQTLTLSGQASVTWGEDSYKASEISVNIETEEIELSGSITGEING